MEAASTSTWDIWNIRRPNVSTSGILVSFDIAGDLLLNQALTEMGAEDQVAFLKNNVDHHTGATFGCHENYLMHREAQFTPELLASLLAFLATRQIFAGAGRVGQANPLAFDFELPDRPGHVNFQISQRADHIVNDIYQWVQFNRAIINARDEPLADYRKYRRLHLLIGDSNMSPFATALKVGTTACVLTLLEENLLPTHIALRDAVLATREISRDPDGQWLVEMDDGTRQDALGYPIPVSRVCASPSFRSGRGDRLDSGELEFHARRHPEQTGAADRRRRLDLEEMAAEHLYGGRRPELAGPLAAKSRSRIPQHQSEARACFLPSNRPRRSANSMPRSGARNRSGLRHRTPEPRADPGPWRSFKSEISRTSSIGILLRWKARTTCPCRIHLTLTMTR